MAFTIGEAAKKTGLTAHTLRYYDKEGLLPFVDKTASGARAFKDSDFEWLSLIDCLKRTGMPLKEIRRFLDLCLAGDATLREQYALFLERRSEVERQMAALRETLEKINYKCWYYEARLSFAKKKSD
ncbi:MAG: MerR family transcriptional regulator [Oscillospiraceae bacterium]|nr:MerR family transcriptional regulator [Oscillospiraceae bacterium]